MRRKQPDEWKYPGSRWMPLMIAVVLLFNTIVMYPAASTLAISLGLTAAFFCFLVQLEYEWNVGILS